MPQGNDFWNPYRLIPIANDNASGHREPQYHHNWTGRAGRIDCSLTALTPFLINYRNQGGFITKGRPAKYFVPATSLKGMIRSLAEFLSNSACPFPRSQIDPGHSVSRGVGEGNRLQLDTAARMFGYLDGGRIFAGLVRFEDGELQGTAGNPLSFPIAGGTPDPDHRAFYPNRKRRKFYHHKAARQDLTPNHVGIRKDQIRTVRPLQAGTVFHFRVHFENLCEEELNLLLYCLALEEKVTVTLSPEALGPDDRQPVVLTGPMRHKLGYAKAQGAGSVHIQIRRLELYPSAQDRYRRAQAAPRILEEADLASELTRRSKVYIDRTDAMLLDLRAMMIYAADDPRVGGIDYPTYAWFRTTGNSTVPLKPIR